MRKREKSRRLIKMMDKRRYDLLEKEGVKAVKKTIKEIVESRLPEREKEFVLFYAIVKVASDTFRKMLENIMEEDMYE